MSASVQLGACSGACCSQRAMPRIWASVSVRPYACIWVAGRPSRMVCTMVPWRSRSRLSGSRAGPMAPMRVAPWQLAQCWAYRAAASRAGTPGASAPAAAPVPDSGAGAEAGRWREGAVVAAWAAAGAPCTAAAEAGWWARIIHSSGPASRWATAAPEADGMAAAADCPAALAPAAPAAASPVRVQRARLPMPARRTLPCRDTTDRRRTGRENREGFRNGRMARSPVRRQRRT